MTASSSNKPSVSANHLAGLDLTKRNRVFIQTRLSCNKKKSFFFLRGTPLESFSHGMRNEIPVNWTPACHPLPIRNS
jgi:hypothetical protein